MTLTPENRWTAAAIVGAAGLAAWWWYASSQDTDLRGGRPRHLTSAAVRGSALDNTLGQVTPDHLLWFGPTMRPPGWVPHRVRYARTPGQELERLTYGAPMACAVAVPDSQRGWLFQPPAEEDY